MPCLDFHLDCPGLQLTDFVIDPDGIAVHAEPSAAAATCPGCGHDSERVHSRYIRRVVDLPVRGRRLVLRLQSRRFYCTRRDCRRRIFCERLPGLAAAHARTTGPLADSHRDIGFALGGEAGARLAEKLAMPTSPDTLLRRVKSAPDEPAPRPRFIGVDDWAVRKGQSYGTIIIDLERQCVIDLLPGRDGEALKAWLKDHPGVEVIARDRWPAFANAATEAAPNATQVADRWHLLKNLREAVERLLARHPDEIREATPETAKPATPADAPAAKGQSSTADEDASAPAAVPVTAPTTPEAGDPVQAGRKAAREARYCRARDLRVQGRSLRQIAHELGMSPRTVLRYLREPTCPDWSPGRPRPTQLDEHAAFIDAWVAGGGRNAAELYRLLRAKGCRAGYSSVSRYVQRKLGSAGRPGPRTGEVRPRAPAPPSARRLSFAFLCPRARDGDGDRGVLGRLRAGVPGLDVALDVAAEFAAMVRKELIAPLSEWLTKAEACGSPDLATFAAGLRTDEPAVAAALTEGWSSGQVEGQVNRLKMIKRMMFGRARLPLLRARVCRKG